MRAGTSLALLATCAIAHAQPSTSATASVEFDRGRALLKERRYVEACAAFEQSLALDPQNGTRYNLAICDEQLGKLATAWSLFHDLGRSDGNATRRKDALKRERALAPRVPHLVIEVPPDVAGLAVTLDGADVTSLVGKPNPIDLGRFTVIATAPGKQRFTAVATFEREGQFVTVTVELLAETAAPTAPAPRHQARSRPVAVTAHQVAPSHRRTYGIAFAASGGALAVAGLVAGNAARGKWNAARALCGSDLGCDDPADVARGNALVDQARSRANLATGLVIAGGAVLATGVVLLVTGRKHAIPTTAFVAPGAAGIAFARSF